MKIFIILFGVFCSNILLAQENTYNKHLADSLGADNYGMKSYFLVILTTGPDTAETKEAQAEIFRGHLDNINRLAKEGILILAGPMGKNDKQYRGLFVLDVESKEKAEMVLQTDPAIEKGLLKWELYNWYGSAALPTYLYFHRQIEKTKP